MNRSICDASLKQQINLPTSYLKNAYSNCAAWQLHKIIFLYFPTLVHTKENQLQVTGTVQDTVNNLTWNMYSVSDFISGKQSCTIKHTHKHSSISLPSMAQLGWALLFLLGSWSSVEEGLPLPRAGSLPRDTLPWAPPLPGAEVAELLQGSPPSVRDALHSGPPTNSHRESSGVTKVTGRSRLQMIKRGILRGQRGEVKQEPEREHSDHWVDG